jgi:heptosyltransferase-2
MTIVPNKILVIQTAFIGDVILATALLEKLHKHLPKTKIDFLVRKGNQGLVENHPYINELIIWDKQQAKYKSLLQLLKKIRQSKYDVIVNTQRFGATGMLTALSGAKIKLGFTKNPFSWSFTSSLPHEIGNGTHEVERNQKLIESITNALPSKPKLFPSQADFYKIEAYIKDTFITISPSSVWFTKQYPKSGWIEFINQLPKSYTIYLLGGPGDKQSNQELILQSNSKNIENLAGKLSLLQSAAVMSKANMNYVNDSGPLHLCSAMNAPVTAVFCSTVPNFGFTPLSDIKHIVETNKELDCRPCGLHGLKACPKGHFDCANTINTQQLLDTLSDN